VSDASSPPDGEARFTQPIGEARRSRLSRGCCCRLLCCRLLASRKHHDGGNEHPNPKRENVEVDDIEKQSDRCDEPEPGEPSREYSRLKDYNGSG
jgi:hypothetical protein